MSHPHLELAAPPKLAKDGLRVVALGGLGEIGRNMTVFEHAGRLLIVDCGVLFPEEHQPGVDVILPDFTWIRDRLDKIDGDRAHPRPRGPHRRRALPAARARGHPLVGSQADAGVHRGEAQGAPDQARRCVEVAEGDRARASGPFDCEFLAVNHSIPDGLAVAIRTAAGLVLHTGDFKMDQFPLDGRITDLRGFARLGEEGVDLFLTDSTNAEVPGFTTSERDLAPGHREGLPHRAAPGHRVQLRQPRAPHPAGARRRPRRTAARSPSSAARWCATWASPATSATSRSRRASSSTSRQLEKLPADKIALVCTGSQGEPMAALSRMANRDHMIRVGEGDTVLLASSLIPGNENAIYRRHQRR